MIRMPHIPARIAGLLFMAAAAGCSNAPDAETTRADLGDEAVITDFTLGPPGAHPGACYGRDVTPAVIEQVSEHVLVAPAKTAADGTVLSPATYEERVTPRVVSGRDIIYFETPCPPRWTPDFISSVQRALTARGVYNGTVSGVLDNKTRQAIRTYQLENGLNSAILSTDSARALGLVEVDLDG